MSSENKQDKLIDLLRNWQKLEDASVQSTTEIIKRSRNPFIQIIMEIIRQDSVMHRRVQQLIIDSMQISNFKIDASEVQELWDKIKEHDEMERKVIKLAEEARSECDSPVIDYLLSYLFVDEKKHDDLLTNLEKLKE